MPNFALDQVNPWAVLVAGVVVFVLGAPWYTVLFGRKWQALNGYSAEKLAAMQAKRPPAVFFSCLVVCYIVAALIVSVIAGMAGVTSAAGGAVLGAVLWIGPTAALKMTNHLASDKPHGVYAIDVSFELIGLVVMGAIVGGWR